MNTPVESKSQERTLTTTSYAVLAVLAMHEHSTYELTKQMRISLHYLWPRAESNVYAEPKRLVAAGLAEVPRRLRRAPRRARSTRSPTPAGRRSAIGSRPPAAASATSPKPCSRSSSRETGTLDDLLAAIRALRDEAAAGVEHTGSSPISTPRARAAIPSASP